MPDYNLNPMAMDDRFVTQRDADTIRNQQAEIGRLRSILDRDNIARHFLYATGMFDSPAEIAANPQHRLVVAAYKAADQIVAC